MMADAVQAAKNYLSPFRIFIALLTAWRKIIEISAIKS
jgi:hypothetical protein